MMTQQDKEFLNKVISECETASPEALDRMVHEYIDTKGPTPDLVVRLAILYEQTPIADPYVSIDIAEKALRIDPANPYAFMVIAYVYKYNFGGVPDDVYERLEILHCKESEMQSMIEFVKSWCWYRKNNKRYVETLKKSITLCDSYVNVSST